MRVKRAAVDPRRFRWPSRLLALLGRVPDTEVARRARFSLRAVKNERRRRGIAPLQKKRPNIVWTEAMVSLLGSDTDANVAGELGVHPGSVTRKRLVLEIPAFVCRGPRPQWHWTERALQLLGTASDQRVARRLGLSASAVQWKRQRLGIKSYRPARPKVAWTARGLGLLGRVPDIDVARRLRIDKASVKRKREELRLPPHDYRARPIARTRALRGLLRLT